jgi:hypothetical protein
VNDTVGRRDFIRLRETTFNLTITVVVHALLVFRRGGGGVGRRTARHHGLERGQRCV